MAEALTPRKLFDSLATEEGEALCAVLDGASVPGLLYRRDGTPLYFRYYDPRVLNVFLPTCSGAQLKEMFGPVDAFVAESEAGDAMTIYRLNGEQLAAA